MIKIKNHLLQSAQPIRVLVPCAW